MALDRDEIIELIKAKRDEAENDSQTATEWHAQALLTPDASEAFAHVAKAATQHTLLQSLLDEIEGKPVYSLWDQ
jgi:hypothetical protein